ncbi:MAG: DUF3137 domain-containing protein [Oscillospiraceae bacterium]|nr:DUF3137 domain-containing protein [Oscillospiraceae bacterium]
MTAIITAIKKKIKVFGWLAIAIIALGIILAIGLSASLGEGGGPVLFIAALAVAAVFLIKWDSLRGIVKKIIKTSFTAEIREMLATAFELESYEPDGFFSPEQLRETHLKSFDECSGSDLVKGKYKGVPFAFCDLLLTEEVDYTDKDGDSRTAKITQLEGQWIEFKLNKQTASAVYVAERIEKVDSERKRKVNKAKELTGLKTNLNYGPYHFGGKVQEAYTDNDLFNKNFQIFTDDPHTMYYILTPHFMEYILAADEAADSRSEFCFTGDRVRIALTNKRNLFDLSGSEIKKSTDFDWVSDKFKSDLRFITDIFDALLKNEYLFGTEER